MKLLVVFKRSGFVMGIRILVIEDEAEIADFITRGLREEGYIVEHAADGVDGGHRLNKESWDLVLLDWWLPGPDGLTLLRRFRQEGRDTPVLFLTARDAVSDRVRGLDCGADDYLCKPFAFEELLARVRSLTRRHDKRQSLVLVYDDLSMDLATQRAERAGRRLDLTAKEQALLVLFLRHPGEVLTRDADIRTGLGGSLRRPLEHAGSSHHGVAAKARSQWRPDDYHRSRPRLRLWRTAGLDAGIS